MGAIALTVCRLIGKKPSLAGRAHGYFHLCTGRSWPDLQGPRRVEWASVTPPHTSTQGLESLLLHKLPE